MFRILLLHLNILVFVCGSAYAQNVGIGTATPQEKLSVVTDLGFGISHEAMGIKLATFIDTSGGWIGTKSNHRLHFYTNDGSPQMTLLQNGNFGIGTVLPVAKLDIRHTSGVLSPTLSLFDESPTGFSRLQFQNASGDKFWHVAGYIDDSFDVNSRLNFFHSVNGDVMSLTGDGKVGIGTVFPTEKLSVVTGYGYGISHEAFGVKLATFLDSGGGWIGTTSNHPFYFYTNNGGAQMSLHPNGNVGIGITTPLSSLHIFTGSAGGATPYSESRLTIEDNDHVYMSFLVPDDKESGILFGLNSNNLDGAMLYNSVSPGGLEFRTNGSQIRMVIDQNGRVGIGMNNPTTPLEVSGTVKATDYAYPSPKTHFISFGGADFRTQEITDVMIIAPFQGYCWMEDGTNPLFASVQLPQDAIITSFIVYCTDNTASENLIVRLRQGHGITSLSDLMAEASSSGVPGNTVLLDNTISFNPVDNVGNFYFITAESSTGTWSDSNLTLNQIQINYTLAGPQ